MGAWGVRAFENDTAGDWVYELEEADGPELLAEALGAAIQADGEYLDSELGANALAAAEVVAALAGRPSAALPDEVHAWLAKHPAPPSPALVKGAIDAVRCVLGDKSELAELWAESDSAAPWQAEVQGLLARLSG